MMPLYCMYYFLTCVQNGTLRVVNKENFLNFLAIIRINPETLKIFQNVLLKSAKFFL